MNCPRCEELVDDGAAFCGNCGLDVRELNQPIREDAPADTPAPADAVSVVEPPAETPAGPSRTARTDLPRYAVANPLQAKFEGKAMAGLIISVLAVPAALVPFLGGILAVAGMVLATTSRSLMTHKTLGNLAIGFSCLAFVLSLAAFSYNADKLSKAQKANSITGSSVDSGSNSSPSALNSQSTAGEPAVISGGHADTKCYSLDIAGMEHVESTTTSCGLRAYNADSLSASSRALTVDTARQADLTESNFSAVAQRLVGNYAQLVLPNFTITSQQQSVFADSPAYVINAKNGVTSMQMAIVYHRAPTGDNVFVVVYGSDTAPADLKPYESAWSWK